MNMKINPQYLDKVGCLVVIYICRQRTGSIHTEILASSLGGSQNPSKISKVRRYLMGGGCYRVVSLYCPCSVRVICRWHGVCSVGSIVICY